MNEEEPVDLSSLDPTADRARFDRLIGSLLSAAAPELARRNQPRTVLGQIVWWERPMLIAATILGLAALSTLALVQRNSGSSAIESAWTTSVGVPAQLSGWVERGEAPSIEMALGFSEETP
jgi:hypothetical protein